LNPHLEQIMANLTVDFSVARFKHLNWKFRIRNFLDGKEVLTKEQAVSHQHCELGKWYYAEGKRKYGHLSSMQIFEAEHEALHAKIKEILEMKSIGKIAEAENAYKELLKISDSVVKQLDAAEASIKNG